MDKEGTIAILMLDMPIILEILDHMGLAPLGRWDETIRRGRTDFDSVYYTSVFL